MLGMLKRHEIEVLLKAGHAKIEVAGLAGVSLSSVKRIAEEGRKEEVFSASYVERFLQRSLFQEAMPHDTAALRTEVASSG